MSDEKQGQEPARDMPVIATTSEQGQEPPEVAEDPQSTPTPKPKKFFNRSDVVRSIKVALALPALYPDYEPFEFEMRLKLSQDAEERRQEFMALAATDITLKQNEQNLDEICDLLLSYPKGFGDLKQSLSPGAAFMDYVKTADPDAKETLYTVIQGAITLYWRKISPQEFRPKV